MEFHRDTSKDLNVIAGYGAEGVRVGSRLLSASCVVSPDRIIENWPATAVERLQPDDLAAVVALEPEIVLLGTGASIAFPAPAVGEALARRGIGLEVMDTAAACRTYNVLAHEGRNVAAALIVG